MHTEHAYIIAEAGVNHNGRRDLALALIDAAADAGADAVKFQTFKAEKLASSSAPKAGYQKANTGTTESQVEMLKKLELPLEWHAELLAHARSKGIQFLSTAFDAGSLDFLTTLDLPLYKIPSGELTNGPLLWRFARTGKPLVVSTGMATLAEVEGALAIIAHGLMHATEPSSLEEIWQNWSSPESRQVLEGHIRLLHCTSQYPTPPEEVNLRAMDTLAASFGLSVGYSDHTEGWLIPVAAVARGACVIEKHFTLDRTLPGPDHMASLEPGELTQMISNIRALELAMGSGRKIPQLGEWDTRRAVRQQVIAARDIPADAIITRADLATARCGHGIEANQLWSLIGTRAKRHFTAGEALAHE